ncbi:MAG: alpha/beta fold hydrolase [Nannocystaceae bacterium]
MALYREIDGPAGAPRIALVHGFSQNRRCWGPFAADLARDHQVVRIDAPGHGRSVDDDDADLWRGAELIADAGGDAIYFGYSMGARLCLHLALAHPERCRGLVLLGANPGLVDAEARTERELADAALATHLEAVGLAEFLEAWLRGPLFASLPRANAHFEERLENRAEGLAASLRSAGLGEQAPLWGRLGAIRAPSLCLAGALDDRFTAIARRMSAELGGPSTFESVPGAGHCAHLEDPAAVLRILRTWLEGQR